jgi:hypothetical protein
MMASAMISARDEQSFSRPSVIARERSGEAIQTWAARTLAWFAALSLAIKSGATAKACAAAIVLAAVLAPTCCLNGAHAYAGGLDGFGPICLYRAAQR